VTVIARRFASVPQRSAVDTWKAIVKLIAPDSASPARCELDAVAGVACSLIASEMSACIVVYGSGPRLRIYCVFGDDAVEGANVSENALSYVPTDGDWQMSLPCPLDELAWVQKSLQASVRVSARDEGEDFCAENSEDGAAKAAAALTINLDAFLRG
jgi:hypothetical protein